MWKDSYRIGVELIDKQHKELFHMVEELMNAIENNADKAVFSKAIQFLKQYTVNHFIAEEEYQAAVSYQWIKEHKKLHEDFNNSVISYEKQLIESEFDIAIVKELAGMLTVWLIYHVADADQKITKNLPLTEKCQQKFCVQNVAYSAVDALEKMAGLKSEEMKQKEQCTTKVNGDVLVEVGLLGDIKGSAYFGFSKELAFKIIEIMMFTKPEQVDELVCSALAEISNIASGNAASSLAEMGTILDITTPKVALNESKNGLFESVWIDTGVGDITISIELV